MGSAWWAQPPPSAGEAGEPPPSSAVLLLHGNAMVLDDKCDWALYYLSLRSCVLLVTYCGYPDASEEYGGYGRMDWTRSDISIAETTFPRIVFGIPDQDLVDASGGYFMGLEEMDDNRPSFLSQTRYKSFALDYRRLELALFAKAPVV